MRKKLLSGLLILALGVGMISNQNIHAKETEEDFTIIEHDTVESDGENYGHISVEYSVPAAQEDIAILDNGAVGLHGSGTLPVSYDARDYNRVSAVKDQGSYGTCWSFAAMSSAESDAIINGRNSNPDYSEAQFAFFTYNRVADPLGGTTGDKVVLSGIDYLSIGGNNYFTTMSLSSWIAPADENVMDYDDISSKYYGVTSVDESYAYESCVAHLQNAYWVSLSDTESVKQMIMEYGSLDSSLYYNDIYLEEETLGSTTDWFFYNYDGYSQNHEISLVGWDDSIPADKFSITTSGGTKYTPEGDGGWLVKNSYGTDYPYNNEGYFWVSYYDTSLLYIDQYGSYNVATAYDFESTDNYKYNYQYDGSYALSEISGSEDTIYAANVFTAQNERQVLEAVGFYTTLPNMEYTIQVYEVTASGTPIGDPLLTEAIEGFQPYAGYHTVKLDESVILEEGDKFSVVVSNTVTTDRYDGVGATIFADASTTYSVGSSASMKCVSSGAAGQSYYSSDGNSWVDSYSMYEANVRIKAFTDVIPVESVEIEEDSYTIGVGEKLQLFSNVYPDDATVKDVVWYGNDDSVLGVSEDGIVTGLKAGRVTVTVESVDGSKVDTCEVIVKDRFPAPDIPVLVSRTENSISVEVLSDCIYSLDGIDWQESNVFTGLKSGTEYSVYAMVPGDDYYYQSELSEPLIVKTYSVVESVAIDSTEVSLVLDEKETKQLTALVSPDDIMIDTVTWTSDNEDIATVDENGLVTAVNIGETVVTATSDGNTDISSSCVVKVYKKFEAPAIKVSYRTHIQTFGWEGKENDIKTWKSNGTMSGTSGLAKRLEGINIVVEPTTTCEDLDLGIQYTTHCQSYGWLPWSADGDMNGTEGEAKRLEAIMIKLTGEHAELYDVYYRVHAQSYGWLGWASNGAPAGTAGFGKRLEGIQIVVVKKGESFDKNMENIVSKTISPFEAKAGESPIVNYPSTSNTNPVVPGAEDVNVAYRTHVQSFGWQGWKYNGQMSGTSGLAKRLEGIEINLTNKDYDGGIAYCTHVQTYAWQGADLDDPTTWKQDGEMAGTSGEAKRLEAICITLTGEMADHYDIYYRVHAQSYGWLGWAKNGAPSGTAGYGKRLEGIQIVVVPKGQAGPTNTYKEITSARTDAYVEK